MVVAGQAAGAARCCGGVGVVPKLSHKIAKALRERGLKRCPRCTETLPLTAFNQHVGLTNKGAAVYCRKCQSEYGRARTFPSTGKHYANNKELVWAQKMWRKYKMTTSQYFEMLSSQNNVCAICGKNEEHRRLAVDHDHKTGKVRSLLCGRCNPAVGFLLDDPALAEKFVAYLKLHNGE